LCYGWIDSQLRRIDDDRQMQWFSPRRPGGIWSAPNKARIARLAGEGLIAEPGWKAIDKAKADGSWSQADDVDALIVPPDLEAALDATPRARARYLALNDSAKHQYLWWIHSAKRNQTRADRIVQTIESLTSGGASAP
ncbi:MAG TPA: YdeI/OmpD-associated family protein, partial [Acidimicrobiia bacterium]|nr:YdeI/OmpD-associated family protein [Acidimicrobiia bacterium]